MTLLLDLEIELHAFRLLRSGSYRIHTNLMRALQEDFPDVPEERLRNLCIRLAERLKDAA